MAPHRERSHSGLVRPLGKRIWVNTHRGFKSHPLRYFRQAAQFKGCLPFLFASNFRQELFLREIPEKKVRRPTRRIVLFVVILLTVVIAIIAITGSLIYNSLSRPRHEAKAVAPNVTVAPFVSLSGENSYPLGLAAASNGDLYLSLFGNGTIVKVDQQATTSVLNSLTGSIKAPGAILINKDGTLYVVDYASIELTKAVGTLKKITPDGKASVLGTGLPLFAQLASDNANNLYVTNPSTGQIWRCTPDGGCVTGWMALPGLSNAKPQPTGIIYDAGSNTLLLADAGTGSVYRLSIKDDGNPGTSLLLYRETGLLIQALALDGKNRILLTAWRNDNGQLSRLEESGVLTVLVDGFREPTSLVVQGSKTYVVNSDLTGIVPAIFGVIPSPYRARPPFTVDAVTLGD
jgi:DNA-binding beta-propeller fold protein YncE